MEPSFRMWKIFSRTLSGSFVFAKSTILPSKEYGHRTQNRRRAAAIRCDIAGRVPPEIKLRELPSVLCTNVLYFSEGWRLWYDKDWSHLQDGEKMLGDEPCAVKRLTRERSLSYQISENRLWKREAGEDT